MNKEFTPPGHIGLLHVIEATLMHLNPQYANDTSDFDKLPQAEKEEKWMQSFHFLRGLLYEEKMTALFVSPIGGGLSAISKDFWLGDAADRAMAQNLYWPFGETPMFRETRPSSPIFFKLDEAERVFAELSGESEPEQPPIAEPLPTGDALPAYVSPYIRIMLDISRKLDISPTNQPKLDVIIAEIESQWGDLPKSKRLMDAMATLVRSPESQGGRRKPE